MHCDLSTSCARQLALTPTSISFLVSLPPLLAFKTYIIKLLCKLQSVGKLLSALIAITISNKVTALLWQAARWLNGRGFNWMMIAVITALKYGGCCLSLAWAVFSPKTAINMLIELFGQFARKIKTAPACRSVGNFIIYYYNKIGERRKVFAPGFYGSIKHKK